MQGAAQQEQWPNGEPGGLRDFLAGRWTLERQVVDRRAGWYGSLIGWAEFTPDGAALRYREEGQLSLPQGRYRTSRGLCFQFADPQRARVRFSDGRFFHDLVLGAAPWRVTHLCGADRYRGRFQQLEDGGWRSVWLVSGPRKRQRIVSLYRRA